MVVIISFLTVALILTIGVLISVLKKSRVILQDNDALKEYNTFLRAQVELLSDYTTDLVEELHGERNPKKPNKGKHLTVIKGDEK